MTGEDARESEELEEDDEKMERENDGGGQGEHVLGIQRETKKTV